MQLIRKHFPEAVFTTYSAEEPCFTSCLPMILKSFGFSYASTKNPNTMWGGYVNAYGGELVNWVGPDGTKLLTVPRYACENLSPNSTWTSVASYNSKEYIRKCLAAGIGNPVGMCIQDAAWSHGWDNGPWLGRDTSAYYTPTAYKTWRDYIHAGALAAFGADFNMENDVTYPTPTAARRRIDSSGAGSSSLAASPHSCCCGSSCPPSKPGSVPTKQMLQPGREVSGRPGAL